MLHYMQFVPEFQSMILNTMLNQRLTLLNQIPYAAVIRVRQVPKYLIL